MTEQWQIAEAYPFPDADGVWDWSPLEESTFPGWSLSGDPTIDSMLADVDDLCSDIDGFLADMDTYSSYDGWDDIWSDPFVDAHLDDGWSLGLDESYFDGGFADTQDGALDQPGDSPFDSSYGWSPDVESTLDFVDGGSGDLADLVNDSIDAIESGEWSSTSDSESTAPFDPDPFGILEVYDDVTSDLYTEADHIDITD